MIWTFTLIEILGYAWRDRLLKCRLGIGDRGSTLAAHIRQQAFQQDGRNCLLAGKAQYADNSSQQMRRHLCWRRGVRKGAAERGTLQQPCLSGRPRWQRQNGLGDLLAQRLRSRRCSPKIGIDCGPPPKEGQAKVAECVQQSSGNSGKAVWFSYR